MRKIDGKEKMIDAFLRYWEVSVIMIASETGLGKTKDLAPSCAKALEELTGKKVELITYRLQGVDESDIIGIPFRNAEKGILEYLKPKQIADIINGDKEKIYLLFLDEVNRAKREMEQVLFKIFDKRLGNDDEEIKNLAIIACINLNDENYKTVIDFSDKALRRRVKLFEYIPSRNDVIDFMIKNNYHEIIIETVQRLNNFLQWETKDERSTPTTLASYFEWNHVLKNLEKKKNGELTIDEIIDDFFKNTIYDCFSEGVGNNVLMVLNEIKIMYNIDFIEEVLKPGSIPKKYEAKKENITLSIYYYLLRSINNDVELEKISLYASSVFNIFEKNLEYMTSFLSKLYEKEEKKYFHSFRREIMKKSDSTMYQDFVKKLNTIFNEA